MTDQKTHHRLDVGASHLAARLAIAIVNLLVAHFFSPAAFFGCIYLSAAVRAPLGMFDKGTLGLLLATLGSLAVVVFAIATAIVALRRRCWRLKYQLFALAGGAAMAVPWALNWR